MKRKLTAVLLTLCMVLGMLPMTALAATQITASEPKGALTNVNVEAVKDITVTAEKGTAATEEEVPVIPVTLTTSAKIPAHANAGGTEGLWIGVAFAAPTGAGQVKAAFAPTLAEVKTAIASAEAEALETEVTTNHDKGYTFYSNGADASPKIYAAIQWLPAADDASGSYENSEITYYKLVYTAADVFVTDEEKVAAAKTAIEALLTEDAVKTAVSVDTVTDTDTAAAAIQALITDEAKGEVTATVSVSAFTAASETTDGSVVYSVALSLNSAEDTIAEATVALPMTGSQPAHTHVWEKVDAVAATCTAAGTKEYYHCTAADCPDADKKYSDEGTTEITDLTIPAKGHTFVDGVCTVCGAADPDYKPAHVHKFELVTGTPATCGAPGTKDYYHCTAAGCDAANKMYADAEGKTEITDLTIPATGKHTFQDGKCTVCGAVDPDYTAPAPVVPGDVSDEDPIDYYQYDDTAAGTIEVAPETTETGVKVETKPVEIDTSKVEKGAGVKIDVTAQIEADSKVDAKEVTEVTAQVKAEDAKALAQQESPILVTTPVADVAVPAAALKEIASEAQTGVTIAVSKDAKEVTSDTKIKVEILVDGKPLAVAKLAAPIQVSVPVAAADEGKTVQVFHINGSRRGLVRGAAGKIVNGILSFSSRHLSEFSYTTDEKAILDVNVLTEALNGGNKSYTYYVLPTDYVVDFVKDGNTAVFHVSTGSSVYETISGGKVNAWVLTKPLTVNADGTVSYDSASLVADSQNIQ